MSAKDKIIFGVLVVLIGVAGYFQYMATNMIARMDELNKNDAEHVDVVHNEFREDLRKLNLQFIGRGKHLQKAQQDIIANTKYIEYVTDSLGNAIQEVQYNLDELDRTVSKQFANVEDDIQDLTDSFNRERRRSKSERAEIKQTITAMQSEIKVLNDKVFGVPEEEKDKK
jgi:gas vesicle protein|tara:strand:- start:30 stop:539 length:510 start_codon:yes stop_codon:yes gene_type:complete